MKINTSLFAFLYIVIVSIDICIAYNYPDYRVYTKPLVLMSLMVYFYANRRFVSTKIFPLTLAALFFSWVGDIVLMYEDIHSLFFILGLVSFLIAHVFYILTFITQWNNKTDTRFWIFLFLILIYGIVLFLFLKDSLGDLMIPVVFYILVILTMVIAALKRKGRTSDLSYKFVVGGALFFIASDSILAINKFSNEMPYAIVLVMGTYALAQYLIIKGLLCENEDMK